MMNHYWFTILDVTKLFINKSRNFMLRDYFKVI